jgi:hypothetical protein
MCVKHLAQVTRVGQRAADRAIAEMIRFDLRDAISIDAGHHKSSRRPLKKGWRILPSADFARPV